MLCIDTQSETALITFDPDKCKEIVEAAEGKARATRQAAAQASDIISGGGKLDEVTCFNKINDLDFDFFSGLPTFQSEAIKKAKKKQKDRIQSLICDAGNEAIEKYNDAVSCRTKNGIRITGSGNSSECRDENLISFKREDIKNKAKNKLKGRVKEKLNNENNNKSVWDQFKE